MSEYEVAVCSLPGDRLGGARRSMVADLGKAISYVEHQSIICPCLYSLPFAFNHANK